MSYRSLKQLLQNYNPADADEKICKQEMLKFLNSYNNCFDRECTDGHFTASALVVNKNFDKALLMHHTKLNKWIQLGGHCDNDPDVLAVAIREASEESGVNNIKVVFPEIFDIDIHIIPEIQGVLSHLHYDIRFLLQIYSDKPVVVSNNESKELRWFGKDDKLPTNSSSVIRLRTKWLDYIKFHHKI